jgi:hypothetical protein
MKKLLFDIHGNLQPSEIIPLSWEVFYQTFVLDFENSEIRQKHINNFISFIKRIQQDIIPEFTIWVNGSFVSKKLDPRDIDAVFLLNHRSCEYKKSILDNQYFIKEFKFTKGLDLYYSIEYPEGHKRHFLSHLNHLYWQDVYGHTRKDINSKQYTKGFIELKIDKSWKN